LEYTIGDQSILVVRTDPGTVKGYFNTCLHRGTRLADGRGNFGDGQIRCRYHAWRYTLDGQLTEIVDRHEFPEVPSDLRLHEVRAERWGGFGFVTMDRETEPLTHGADPTPQLTGPFHRAPLTCHPHPPHTR